MKCKKLLAILLALCLILSLTSCGQKSEQDEKFDELTKSSAAPGSQMESSASEPVPEDTDISGTLTLKTPDEFYWSRWVKHFNKKYPNVTVELVGTGTDRGTYAQQTIVELMGGEAPADLVDMNYLPYFDCVEAGVFENLLAWIDNDPVVKKDELYTNVLDAVTYKDSAAGLPLAFLVNGMRLNKAMLAAASLEEAPETASFPEMIEWYNKAKDAGAAAKDSYFTGATYNPYTCFHTELQRYLKEKEKTASFDDPAFTELLSTMKTVSWNNLLDFDTEYAGFSNLELSSRLFMNDQVAEILGADQRPLYEGTDTATPAIQLAASDGTIPFGAVVGPVGIPVASENKELAWRFIRFFLSEMELEGQKPYEGDYFGPTPLNLRNALELAKGMFPDDEKAVETADAWASRVNAISLLTNNELLLQDINKIFNEYFQNDLISAEECAKKIQDRAEMFLLE